MEEREKIFEENVKKMEERKDIINKEEYIRIRRDYRRWCEEERKKHEKEEERKIRMIRTEKEAWQYINKYRRKRETVDNGIGMEEQRRYFIELLGETERKAILEIEKKGDREERREQEEEREIEDLTSEEINESLRRLKLGKAPGEDGIDNKAWKYGI